MAQAADPGSFRDPSGRVFIRDGVLYRQVNPVFREHYDALMECGLYQALVAGGLLVSHEEDPHSQPLSGEAYRVLRPERIPLLSYPYEWCFSQLRDAALLTLEAQEVALDHGMALRDASAYNVQFRDGRPILIDTLSFELLREGEPWVGYRQFCQHFLAPLALMRYRDLRMGRLLRVHLDGVPVELASSLLPLRSRFRPSLLVHLHLHARSVRRHAEAAPSDHSRRSGRFGLRALRGLIDALRAAVGSLPPPEVASAWSDYYGGDSYTADALAHKEELVGAFLEETSPRSVWDLGANTGRFARLAAARGIPTMAFDADPASVEAAYREEAGVLPLVMDLTNPSPGLGWANRERASLGERGPADLVMALALVHHLAIANNVPLGMVADWLAELAPRLIVEFVPKHDPKVGLLLAGRQDVFVDYTQEGFEAAFESRFRVARREPIKQSERMLYLMKGR